MESEPTVVSLLQQQVAEVTRERMMITESLVQMAARAGHAEGELSAMRQQSAVVQMQADRAAEDAASVQRRMSERIYQLERELAQATAALATATAGGAT